MSALTEVVYREMRRKEMTDSKVLDMYTYNAKEPLMVAEEMKYMTDRRRGLNGNKSG